MRVANQSVHQGNQPDSGVWAGIRAGRSPREITQEVGATSMEMEKEEMKSPRGLTFVIPLIWGLPDPRCQESQDKYRVFPGG